MPDAISALRRGSESLGVPLDDGQLEKLARYLELLLEWNQKINLTAVTDPAEAVERHFLDSLAVVPRLANTTTLVDVGTGPGFPGLVIACAKPHIRVTCIDSINKKIAFLRNVSREISVPAEILCTRLETLVSEGRRFECAVSRATFSPQRWVAAARGLVTPGGRILAMVTADEKAGEGAEAVRYRIGNVDRRIDIYRV